MLETIIEPTESHSTNLGNVSLIIPTNNRRPTISDVPSHLESVGYAVPTSDCRPQTSYASTILPNGINTEGRPIAGIDWSRSEVIVNVEGQPIAKFKTLSKAAKHYPGYIWVLESTADSFELQNRQKDLNAIKKNNIKAYCFNPKFTSNHRIKWNDIAKTDEADSGVIRRIFTETNVTCGVFKQIIRKDKLREKIKKVLVKDRQYEGKYSTKIGRKYLSDPSKMPTQFHELIYDAAGLKLKTPRYEPRNQIGRLLIVAENVREANRGFRMFRRQVGDYGQGYGSMSRSEFYWWIVRIITNSRLKKVGLIKEVKDSHIDPKTKESKKVRIWSLEEDKIKRQAMKEAHKMLKFLWKLTI